MAVRPRQFSGVPQRSHRAPTARDEPAPGNWVSVRCLVERGGQLDTFLSRLLRPFLSRLVRDGEVTRWLFDRPVRHVVDIDASGPDRHLLAARLLGLTSAAAVQSWPRASRWPSIADPIDPTSPVAVRCRSTGLALEVIAGTPTRPARLRAALDLAIVTAIEVAECHGGPVPRADSAWLWQHRLVDTALRRRAATCGLVASTSYDRWRSVRETLRHGLGPLAGWQQQLRSLALAHHRPRQACDALLYLYRQVGLRSTDERLILASLSRSLLRQGHPAPRSDLGRHEADRPWAGPASAMVCTGRLRSIGDTR